MNKVGVIREIVAAARELAGVSYPMNYFREQKIWAKREELTAKAREILVLLESVRTPSKDDLSRRPAESSVIMERTIRELDRTGTLLSKAIAVLQE